MNEWISVEDRLPYRDCKVIVFGQKVRGGFIKKECFITTAVFCMTMIDKHYFDFKGNGDGIVTHWMPLPEPPREAPPHARNNRILCAGNQHCSAAVLPGGYCGVDGGYGKIG